MISSDHFTALRAISAYVGCLRIDSTLLSLLDVFLICSGLHNFQQF